MNTGEHDGPWGRAACTTSTTGGLEQAPLTEVVTVRTASQTVAGDLLAPVEYRSALVEGPVITQDMAGQGRIADHERRQRAQTQPYEVSARGEAGEEAKGVA
ncbi:hypothetical protein ACFCYC_24630 [Streptomyces sp. NPDC056402]|uniref:hypothetical protein n=1 Tax=Streptomyces sp. NPDC056402 TaxID=3345810 RepID=UPI0035DEE92B